MFDFQVLRSKFVKFFLSVLKRQFKSFSIFESFFIIMTHKSSISFKLIHFLLWRKGSHQIPNFDTFECSDENLSNYSCHFPNHKSVFFQILHHSSMSWKMTPLYSFSSNNIYSAQKEPIKVNIFEIFECSSQNFSNSFCQVWNENRFLFKFSILLQCHER